MTVVVAQKRAEARSRYYTREEAQRLKWDVNHPAKGGRFLEEQEIVDRFPALRSVLGQDRPDFGILANDQLLGAIVECKNDYRDLETAVKEAIGYADAINGVKGFDVRVAIGVAGTPDTLVRTRVMFRRVADGKWVALQSHGFPLTQLPTPDEMAIAIERGTGDTDVELPSEKEFADAAIAINRILRLSKIQEPQRPKVLGAIITALHHDQHLNTKPQRVLEHINLQVGAAIDSFTDIPSERRKLLAETLHLSTEAEPLRESVSEVVSQLERLNIRSIMRSGVDFLGKFYEAFLRYGGDSKAMGIVFTPRHITRFCADLLNIRLGMKVYDPAQGTGGFLVAAFDRMWREATTEAAKKKARESLYGCDTNATVWALAILNMFFRGDGKSHLAYGSCFRMTDQYRGTFNAVLLNPPFSQEGEPETMFIDHSLVSLVPGGEAAIVVPAGVLVDKNLRHWRRNLVEDHRVLAVISLPADVFYPTGAPTAVLVVRAHTPDNTAETLLVQITNDGYEISKSRRVETSGGQLDDVLNLYRQFLQRGTTETVPDLAIAIGRDKIKDGGEILAQRWLPSASFTLDEFDKARRFLLRSMSVVVANRREVKDELIADYEQSLAEGPSEGRPTKRTTLDKWFEVVDGKTTQAKSYPEGPVPYLSSGDSLNSIDSFLTPPDEEIFAEPCITVTGFGQAYIQPWRFCMRTGAGSAPHILRPKFGMSLAELMWFAGQINSQKWRFYYARMANKGRLHLLEVDPPPEGLPTVTGLINRLEQFEAGLDDLYAPHDPGKLRLQFREWADEWVRERPRGVDVADMVMTRSYQRIIGMGEAVVPLLLEELERKPDHWFWALHAITGENPVPPQSEGKIKEMAAAWIKWGKQRGYRW